MRFSTSLSSPFPDLEKAHHVLGIDDKVIYVPTGHKGKITNIEHGIIYVTLASGHVIGCSRSDIVPSDFPPAERPPAAPAHESMMESKLAAVLPNAGGLIRALRDGSISDRDRVLAKMAFDNVKACRGVSDPYGETESHDVRTLHILAEKYADIAETFTKAAGNLSIGDRVRVNGKLGKVTALKAGGAVDIACDDGTECTVVSSHVESVDSLSKRSTSSAFHPGQKVDLSDGRSGTVTRIGEFSPHCIAVTLPSGVLVECLPEDVRQQAA